MGTEQNDAKRRPGNQSGSTRNGSVRPVVLEYMRANAERVLTLYEVRTAYPDLHPVSIAGAMRQLAIDMPEQVVKLRHGTYKYLSKPVTSAQVTPVTEEATSPLLLVPVSSSVDPQGRTVQLMKDDETDELYVVRAFTFQI